MRLEVSTQRPQDLSPLNLQIRSATFADIPFLSRIEFEASLPPMNKCFWDELLQDTEISAMQFIAAMLEADASNWGRVNDFLVLEAAGQPCAAAAGYTPYAEDYRPLNLSRLDRIAQLLGWSMEQATVFRRHHEYLWGDALQPEFLRPQAPWIIETVAVLPEARGHGYSKTLLKALLEKGRSRHLSHAGIMVVNGNEIARHTYESLGFKPYLSFHAEYFNHTFPGITKFRMPLTE